METLSIPKNGKSSNPKEDVKITDTQKGVEILKAVTEKPMTAQDRIERAKVFETLRGKFETLKAKEVELEQFDLGRTGEKEKIVLYNSAGKQVEIVVPGVVIEFTKVLREKTKAARETTEAQILEFKI